MISAVIEINSAGTIVPKVSSRDCQSEFSMSKAGRERMIKNTIEARATVPAVENNTFTLSNSDRREREEGLVAKKSHSIEA
jgi:hypothetical protein